MTNADAVRARGLWKKYGRHAALAGVDLTVPEGKVVLLVGPNGAGKTTLLRVLLDLLPADGGEVEVLGRSPAREGAAVRAGIGFLPEGMAFPFDRMRVRDVLAFHARFRPTWDEDYAQRLSEELELRLDHRWKKLSKGESRRAQVVTALAHRPPLLLLDEPTDGLDPLIRERVLGILAEHLAETGATTLYCTHVLHEAQAMADRLLVLSKGQVRMEEDVEVLRQSLFRVRFRESGEGSGPPEQPQTLIREEGRGVGGFRWIMRGREEELRSWASGVGVQLDEVEPVSVADAALAYLTDAPRKGGVL